MELVYLIVVGIGLYILSSWILDRIEIARGRRFEQRQIIFFAILLALALATFALLRGFLGA